MLRAATNNFSEENKLGEGGFGEVFKVHFHLYVHTTRSCSIIGICGQCLFQLTSSSFKKKISRPCLFASSFPLLQEREAAQADRFSAGDSPAPFLSGGVAAGE